MAHSLLLADDSPTIAKILRMALQSEAYEIRDVLTAEDAIRELRANPPYFFLVDLTLPEKNGYDFARFVKQESKLRQVRVVLLASAFEPVDEKEFQACGADALVKKPFDPAELRAKLRSIVDAPPKFPTGTHVVGSLSGQAVSADLPPGRPPGLPASPPSAAPSGLPLPAAEESLSSLLELGGPPKAADADSILADMLEGEAPPRMPPKVERLPEAEVESPTSKTHPTQFTNATIHLDLSGQNPSEAPPEPVLDLSGAFDAGNGGGSTAMIDLSGSQLLETGVPGAAAGGSALREFPELREGSRPLDLSILPPPSPGGAKPQASAAPPPFQPARAPGPAGEPLSANAQALAAFFAAEIDAQGASAPAAPAAAVAPEAPPAPMAEGDDSFDASLSSIDWGTPAADQDLSAWSSSALTPKAAPAEPSPRAPTPTPAPTNRAAVAPASPARSAPAASSRPPAGAAGPASPALAPGDSFLFDTGGSTFRFADNYVSRITRAFTGSLHEEVPAHHGPVAAESALFPQRSDDAPRAPTGPAASPANPAIAGGGAWSEADVKRIEQIVREEVQMVVREVAEKVAWEVIPELAENLIRKELDKVLKEMEQP